MAEVVAPSKTVLLEQRDERALVTEGKSVLEERRDILAREMMSGMASAVDEWRQLAASLETALAAVCGAIRAHGPGGVRRQSLSSPSPGPLSYRQRNHFGTRLLEANLPAYEAASTSTVDSSVNTALARRRMQELLQAVARHAATDNNLVRMDHEFRRAQRKVNALDYVVLPVLDESIRYIEFALEEAERENMIRALGVKRRGR